MTIQEAINMMKYRIDTATEIAGKYENENAFEDMEMAIKALEEQQKIKEDGFSDYLLNMGYTKGYLAAIDKFAEKISTYGTYDHYGNTIDILEIAEQMKKGE